MEEEKSELSCKDKVISENFDHTDSSVKSNVLLTKVPDLLIQQDVKLNKNTMLIQEKLEPAAQIEKNSVLLSNNDEKEYYSSTKENSINVSIKSSISLSNLLDKELLKQKSLFDNIYSSPVKSLQKSSSCNDVRLFSTISSDSVLCISSNKVCNSDILSMVSDKCQKSKSLNHDEEETLFSNKLDTNHRQIKPSDENVTTEKFQNHEVQSSIESVEYITENSNLNAKLIENNGHKKISANIKRPEEFYNSEEQNSAQSIKNIKSQSNAMLRPSLIDDSKLVKISLPTNPINIMQTNAQFLNKSRNFLNFITEKSTNIMEKALLPQHLTVKYNSVMKSIDNTYSERKHTEESCNVKSCLTVSTVEKAKNISCPLKKAGDVQSKKNECTVNCENKSTYAEYSNEGTCLNIQKNSSDITDTKLNITKEIESYSVSNNIHKISDALCIEASDNCNEDTNSMILNSEHKNDTSSNNSIAKSMSQPQEQVIDIDNSKQSLLKHPAYLTLLKDHADLKAKYLKLEERVEYLTERNRILEIENKGEIYSIQIETLEKTINRLTSELHTSLTTQEMFKKEYNAANKERESMVMKYAVSEKQLIDTQRARENAERKAKDSGKQQELLQNKLREMQNERIKIYNMLDGKCREVTDLQKEVERLKENINMRDVKLKWSQNKLKTEMDLQNETQQKLEKAMVRINEMKEECEQVRKETQESMRKFQQSEENKAVTLDQQLKEQQAQLILERHVTEDKEMLRLQLQKEVEILKNRQQVLIEENNMLSLKIQDCEKNRLNYESNLSNLKIIADQRQKEIVELLSKVSELETLKVQLQHKDQHLASIETEIKDLRSANEELQADMFACRQKEAEMLDFTQKLTDKNVRLQSDFTTIEAKARQLEKEHGPLHERISDLNNRIKLLEESLGREQKMRSEECEILARHLAEQTQAAQNLAQKLEDSQGENAVLKRKQQISMKEMTRELQQCRKKLEAFEATSPYNSLGVTSRTGSNMSLNTGDTLNGALSDNSMNGEQSIQSVEPSRQVLIDRIIKLQEDNARKAEKLDFFEEHSKTLVEELQKKTRIIQNYILHENSGAMGSNERERYKAELARHGGIMASVYNQRVSDDNMTLELSLEINQKLQAVLEDALFKNITLKDNIDTLGEEIARLTMQNRQREITN